MRGTCEGILPGRMILFWTRRLQGCELFRPDDSIHFHSICKCTVYLKCRIRLILLIFSLRKNIYFYNSLRNPSTKVVYRSFHSPVTGSLPQTQPVIPKYNEQLINLLYGVSIFINTLGIAYETSLSLRLWWIVDWLLDTTNATISCSGCPGFQHRTTPFSTCSSWLRTALISVRSTRWPRILICESALPS